MIADTSCKAVAPPLPVLTIYSGWVGHFLAQVRLVLATVGNLDTESEDVFGFKLSDGALHFLRSVEPPEREQRLFTVVLRVFCSYRQWRLSVAHSPAALHCTVPMVEITGRNLPLWAKSRVSSSNTKI